MSEQMQALDKLESDWHRIHREAAQRVQSSKDIEERTKHMSTLLMATKNYEKVAEFRYKKQESLSPTNY